MLLIRAAALSDIGRVRRENEDRFLFDEKKQLFGVADGVGGLPGGAEAAQRAADEIAAALEPARPYEPAEIIATVHRTNRAVALLGRTISPSLGIGTTLTFGLVRGTRLTIAHVGDSRCYALRKDELYPLTEDHSVENEARMRRARGEVVYYHESNRHALTRCIGQPTPPEVDVIHRDLVAGERYLFCTDGVTRMVAEGELATMLAAAVEPKSTLQEIISLAVRRGGPDNATGVLLMIDSP